MESSRNAEQCVIPGSIEQLSGLANSFVIVWKVNSIACGSAGGDGSLVGGSLLSPLWDDGFCSWYLSIML